MPPNKKIIVRDEKSAAETERKTGVCVRGIAVSPGTAAAPTLLIRASSIDIPKTKIKAADASWEWIRFNNARELTRRQLLALAAGNAGVETLIDAHIQVLDDEMLLNGVHREIFENLLNAELAVHTVGSALFATFSALDDPYLRERADDITDITRRLLRGLLGIADSIPSTLSAPSIIVAEMLTPSEMMALPRGQILGVILERGSITSHAALIVRALGIPAVFGATKITSSLINGQIIALDGSAGTITINPSPDELLKISEKAEHRAAKIHGLTAAAAAPAITPDGKRITLLANIQNASEIQSALSNGAEGIGLLRTEYLWMQNGSPIPEDRQFEIYCSVAKVFPADAPIVIRAFDLGGDKFASGDNRRHEDNPFLGLRSIRYLLSHSELFKIQLRAILRAREVHKNIHLMLPMVTDACEIDMTKELLPDTDFELGAMIEVPSAAVMAETIAARSAFLSIGTNDLTQYTLAVDRINENVAHLYIPTHPAVIHLIKRTIDAAHAADIPCSICGEMASDPLCAVLLVGLGAETLSMTSAAIPLVKEALRKTPLEKARKIAQMALTVTSHTDVTAIIERELAELKHLQI